MKIIEQNLGNGYKLRATYEKVGAMDIVSIDWEHPNYDGFADGMIWYRGYHNRIWTPVHIVRWSEEYNTLEDFIKDHPLFEELFFPETFDCD